MNQINMLQMQNKSWIQGLILDQLFLKYFEKLKEVDVGKLADRDDQLQVNGRDDICTESEVSPDQFSPYLDGNFFKVPRVIEQN